MTTAHGAPAAPLAPLPRLTTTSHDLQHIPKGEVVLHTFGAAWHMLNRRLTLGVVLVVAALTFAAMGAPAARAAQSDCPRTYLCAWVHLNFTGNMGKWAGNNSDWRRFRQSQCAHGTWNDCLTSVYNRGTQCSVWLFRHINFAGDWFTLARGNAIANVGPYWNDSVSSNRWCR